MRRWFGTAALLGAAFTSSITGCGGGAAAGPEPSIPANGPGASGAPSPAASTAKPAEADPFALPAGPRDDTAVGPEPSAIRLTAWAKASKASGLAPAPAVCGAFAKRASSALTPKDLAPAAPLSDADRTKQLSELAALPAATTRAVVADFAPAECSDVIVDAVLTKNPALAGRAGHAVVGLSLAGKLARTASALPSLKGANDKAAVLAFVRGPLQKWLVEQATAIETLSAGAAELTGYGRGVAAIEAGSADLRLVDKMREAPVPKTWDAELKGVYEAALDEALEPRKKRGRDAALVGLADFAEAGVLGDPRVSRARTLLSKLYGGRRIDALDALLLPPAAAVNDDRSATAPIATTSFWSDADVAFAKPAIVTDPSAGRAANEVPPSIFAHGIAEQFRSRARTLDAWSSPALRSSYARARFEMGRTYWRRVDFVEAAHAAASGATPEDRLILALSLALAHGPKSAREMMSASPETLDLSHTEALDALAAKGGPLAGMAAFDAAHLRSLSPPVEGADLHWRAIAERFGKASALLTDPVQKKLANDRAIEAIALAESAAGTAPGR